MTVSYAKFTTDSWRNVLSQYPQLKNIGVEFPFNEIEASSTHLPIMLNALNGIEPSHTILCSNLERLDLFDLTCGDNFEGLVRSFLQTRITAGLRLKTLRTCKPNIWEGSGEFKWPDLEGLVDSFERLD